jgi:hypothetical protein
MQTNSVTKSKTTLIVGVPSLYGLRFLGVHNVTIFKSTVSPFPWGWVLIDSFSGMTHIIRRCHGQKL